MQHQLLLAATALTFFYALLSLLLYLFSPSHDPSEPPLLPARLPLLGHALGFLQHGNAYFGLVTTRHPYPVSTISAPFLEKAYIVVSLPTILSLRKHSTTLTSNPFVKLAAASLAGVTPETLRQFDASNDRPGLTAATIDASERGLAKEGLGPLSSKFLDLLCHGLTQEPVHGGEVKGLLEFVRRITTLASTTAVYGPGNPLQREEVLCAFWTAHELRSAAVGISLPTFFARREIRARESTAKSFEQYYEHNNHLEAGLIVRERYNAAKSYGVDDMDIGRLDVVLIFSVLTNTIPTIFWALMHILADPELLVDLRAELEACVSHDCAEVDGHDHEKQRDRVADFAFDLPKLKRSCPLLLSIYHETLRVHSTQPNILEVESDTWIPSETSPQKYHLLKAHTPLYLMVPAVHRNRQNWGTNAAEIDMRRFMRKEQTIKAATFQSFGGVPYICPGRQFATTVICATLAMLVLRYEFGAGSCGWKVPADDGTVIGAVSWPKGDCEVVMKEREGWEGRWRFKGGVDGRWALVSG